mgnify:CR=1 FL=1
MFGSIRSPWPIVSGSYTLGSMDSPIALVVIGRAIFELGKEHYCIRGHLRSANIGIEKLIANVVSNPEYVSSSSAVERRDICPAMPCSASLRTG